LEDESFWAEVDPWMRRFGKNPQFQLYYDDPSVKLVAVYWHRIQFGILVRRLETYSWRQIGFITEEGWEWINEYLKLRQEQQEQTEEFEPLTDQEAEELEGW
jgi:hypothetical protein